jgi:adenosylhomocysteine nucleosidase
MKDLILIALKSEAPEMQSWDNVFFTGVGKVNAAIRASALIQEHSPTTVWNFGTAGGINTACKDLVEVSNFVQRDMRCCELGFDLGMTPFEDYIAINFNDPDEGYTCSTGDNFVDNPDLELPADIVDMEAYAIAKACQYHGVEFKCFKYISDSADENANKEWHETVANGEPHYINVWDTHTSNLNDYDTQLQLDMD